MKNFSSSKVYALVLTVLMILLGVTFLVAHIDLGLFNVPTSLFIAAVKAFLVVLYFMHIRYSIGLNRVAAGVGVFWLGILITLTLTDYLSRNWLLLPSHWP